MKELLLSLTALLHALAPAQTPSPEYLALVPHVLAAQVTIVQQKLAQSPLTATERTKLADVARGQQDRTKLELEVLGNKKIRWGLISKGCLQMLGAAYCAGNTFVTIWSGVQTAKRDQDTVYNISINDLHYGPTTIVAPEYIDELRTGNRLANFLAILIHLPLALYRDIYDLREHSHPQYINASVPTTLTLLSLWATYSLACKSMHNVKSGWNYRAVLEKKLEHLDEIITCLETQT